MKKIIKISEKDRNYIERIDLERVAHQNLIAYMINNKMADNFNEQFKKYNDEYIQLTKEFDEAKTFIINKYVNLDTNYNWSLQYKNCELTINYE